MERDSETDDDQRSLRELEMAGYTREDARDLFQQYPRHTLTIPRKPVQKPISSHFKENLSPTSPTAPARTSFPDIEIVSQESLTQRTTGEENTRRYFPDFDFETVTPETVRDHTPVQDMSRELSIVQEEPVLTDRPLS